MRVVAKLSAKRMPEIIGHYIYLILNDLFYNFDG